MYTGDYAKEKVYDFPAAGGGKDRTPKHGEMLQLRYLQPSVGTISAFLRRRLSHCSCLRPMSTQHGNRACNMNSCLRPMRPFLSAVSIPLAP